MWVKVDDGFTEHQKIFAAAELLGGAHAYARIISMTMQGNCFASRTLTDGFLPRAVVAKFHDSKPLHVAALLVKVVLWEPAAGGYRIHDYDDYNPSAQDVKDKREDDRQRQREHREQKKLDRLSQTLSQRDRPALSQTLSRCDSARNPERSRARDPVPSPVQEQERTSTGAAPARRPPRLEMPTHAQLCVLAAEVLKTEPADSLEADVKEAMKTRCARLQLLYDGDAVGRALNAVGPLVRKYA